MRNASINDGDVESNLVGLFAKISPTSARRLSCASIASSMPPLPMPYKSPMSEKSPSPQPLSSSPSLQLSRPENKSDSALAPGTSAGCRGHRNVSGAARSDFGDLAPLSKELVAIGPSSATLLFCVTRGEILNPPWPVAFPQTTAVMPASEPKPSSLCGTGRLRKMLLTRPNWAAAVLLELPESARSDARSGTVLLSVVPRVSAKRPKRSNN
mmetsp:Transcript_9358/g.26954  ORF Transcript_9358/g.26954 Transcript_9358/m.26954 type:complete len:212 (-) Transcript_9358:975-1610(-)